MYRYGGDMAISSLHGSIALSKAGSDVDTSIDGGDTRSRV